MVAPPNTNPCHFWLLKDWFHNIFLTVTPRLTSVLIAGGVRAGLRALPQAEMSSAGWGRPKRGPATTPEQESAAAPRDTRHHAHLSTGVCRVHIFTCRHNLASIIMITIAYAIGGGVYLQITHIAYYRII